MSSDLTSGGSARLERDGKLSDEAKLLALAALEGRTAVADVAGYTPPAPATDLVPVAEPTGGDHQSMVTTLQRQGEKREAGTSSLG